VELNLRHLDIVNMAVARHARAPVLLAGDIDRGGIFAQLLGTLSLLEADERALVRGLVVNKFRGDRALFADGVRILEERGGVPVLGVVPHLTALAVPEEDAVALDRHTPRPPIDAVEIAVIRLPHIANFDDFDPLAAEPGVALRYVGSPRDLGAPHAVILPGTKSTVADLAWLRATGLAGAIEALAGRGAAVVGVCGGYQMLGRVIRDPHGVESSAGEVAGLGLLPVETTFAADKATCRVRARVLGGPGWLSAAAGQDVDGYEIHMGRSPAASAWLDVTHRNGPCDGITDGAFSDDGRVWGCYLHGLFANPGLRRAWLDSLRRDRPSSMPDGAAASLDAALDRLADAVAAALDMNRLEAIIQESD
jgi:adenosylcobyric acid synthase